MYRIIVIILASIFIFSSSAIAQNLDTIWRVTIPEVPGGIISDPPITEYGTLHFVIQRFGPIDGYVGMTNGSGLQFDDYEIQVGSQGKNTLWVRDFNKFRNLGEVFEIGQTYCAWMQIDTLAGEYRVHWKPLASPGEPPALYDRRGESVWDFRNGPKSLTNVLAKVGYYHGGMMEVSRVYVGEGYFLDSPTVGCNNIDSPPREVVPTATDYQEPTITPTPLPTYTPYPTFEPLSTLEPLPTHTSYPTATPYPTLEPLPTHTPMATLQPPVCDTPQPPPNVDPIGIATATPDETTVPTATIAPTRTATMQPTAQPAVQTEPTSTDTPATGNNIPPTPTLEPSPTAEPTATGAAQPVGQSGQRSEFTDYLYLPLK